MGKRVATEGDLVRYECVRGDKVFRGVGRIISGSPRTNVEGKRMARDRSRADCGPCGIGSVQASGKARVDGKKVARLNDPVRIVAGNARIITASSTVDSD